MAIKTANAYDTNAGRWIGRVPVTWFDRFPHLSHEGPAEAESTAQVQPSLSWTRKQLSDYAREKYGLRLDVNGRKAPMLAAIATAAMIAASQGENGGDENGGQPADSTDEQ